MGDAESAEKKMKGFDIGPKAQTYTPRPPPHVHPAASVPVQGG